MTGPVVLRAEVAVEAAAEHAEGPLWDDRDGTLLWVDQYQGIVRRAKPTTAGALVEEPPFDLGMAIGAVVPDRAGSDTGWLVAAGAGFHRLDRSGLLTPIADILPDDGIRRRMNDGKLDPLGRFWAGTVAYDKTPGAGALYRLDGGTPRLMLDGVTISNGLAWTPDGGTLFYIDTPTRTVRRFTVDGDTLRDAEVVIRIPPEQGAPDGMCVDADGCLWVALWGGGAVHRYDTTGRLLARVEVAAAQVSSCAFGGPDLATLYITTSAEDYDAADLVRDPEAGKIFSIATPAH